MRASYRWLKQLSKVEASPEAFSEALTQAGLEVEGATVFGQGLDRVVVGEVRRREKVPDKDKLSRVTVFDGTLEIEVICGAPNVPNPGGKILFAQEGAVLPNGMEIGARKIAGVTSRGMICSEEELAIGEGGEGIVVIGELGLTTEPTPGTHAAIALGLDDVVFELGITPNRPDALGHVGLARELALAFDVPFSWSATPRPVSFAEGAASFQAQPATSDVAGSERAELSSWFASDTAPWAKAAENDSRSALAAVSPAVRISIRDGDRCPRYAAGQVSGVTVGPSPFWLRYRLFVLGLRSINNVVDATNLAMLERGHPVHAFDLSKVDGHHVIVRCAQAGERLTTLDGNDRALDQDDLLICDPAGPIALAGVMGGARSEISKATNEVLVEVAYFSAPSIRRTSRRSGLHTDASHRFERGVDPEGVVPQLARTVQLIADLGGGTANTHGLDAVASLPERPTIQYRTRQATRLLGHAVAPALAKQNLAALGCELVEDGEDDFSVVAPSHRPDLAREADLIEEVGRTVGYKEVAGVAPRVRPATEGRPAFHAFKGRVKNAMASAGFHEAIGYAFVSEKQLDAARALGDRVELVNPLSEERAVLRTALLPGLADAVRLAQSHQVQDVCLFEIGRVFKRRPVSEKSDPNPLWAWLPGDEALPAEETRLGFLMSGSRRGWIGQDGEVDFYDAKGALEQALGLACGAQPVWVLAEPPPGFLHPKRCASVRLPTPYPEGTSEDVEALGWVGELHPEVVDGLQLQGRPVFGTLSYDRLLAWFMRRSRTQAVQPTRFPGTARDLALLVDDEVPVGRLSEAMVEFGKPLMWEASLFDLYRGDQVPPGKKSVAFRLQYRDPAGTLTDKQVDKAHAAIAKGLQQRFSLAVR